MFAFLYMGWFWLALMVAFLLPVGYGWGYRGWGAPYPTYIQRRRRRSAVSAGTSAGFDHHAWGRAGDLVWGLLFIDVLFFAALFWRR